MSLARVGSAMLLQALLSPPRLLSQAPELPVFERLEVGSCPRCAVHLERVTIVGSPRDEDLLTESGLLFPLRGGERVAIQGQSADFPILHYDAAGHYLGTLGVIGDGPGEFRSVKSVASMPGDSLAILGPGRLTIISLGSGRGRSVSLPVGPSRAFRMLVRPGGSFLLQTYDERSPAFIVFDSIGRKLRDFGPAPVITSGGRQIIDAQQKDRAIASSPAGGFWAMPIDFEHRLEHWSDAGKLIGEIRRPVEWFKPYTRGSLEQRGAVDPGEAPILPRASSLWVSPEHRIFALTLIPDLHWQRDPGAPPAATLGGSQEGSPTARELTGGIARYIDVILEIYDETSGKLLGSWRSDEPTGWFGEDGLLYHETKDSDGVRVFQVWRLVLTEN